MTWRNIIK